MAGSGHLTQKGWNVPTERPVMGTEVLRNENPRNNQKSDRVRNRLVDEPPDNVHDINIFRSLKQSFLIFSSVFLRVKVLALFTCTRGIFLQMKHSFSVEIITQLKQNSERFDSAEIRGKSSLAR